MLRDCQFCVEGLDSGASSSAAQIINELVPYLSDLCPSLLSEPTPTVPDQGGSSSDFGSSTAISSGPSSETSSSWSPESSSWSPESSSEWSPESSSWSPSSSWSTSEPSITPGAQTPDLPCQECHPHTPHFDKVNFACNSSDPYACSRLCPDDVPQIQSCISCFYENEMENYPEFTDYLAYADDAQFYCSVDAGFPCSELLEVSARLCGDDSEENQCRELCQGPNWDNVKRCEEALPGSGLTGNQASIIAEGIATLTEFCTMPPKPVKKGCAGECDAILVTYDEMCKDKNAQKCRGMCTVSPLDRKLLTAGR